MKSLSGMDTEQLLSLETPWVLAQPQLALLPELSPRLDLLALFESRLAFDALAKDCALCAFLQTKKKLPNFIDSPILGRWQSSFKSSYDPVKTFLAQHEAIRLLCAPWGPLTDLKLGICSPAYAP